MRKTKGFLSLLTAGIIFGSFGIWIRLLSQEMSIYQQIAFRNIVGFIIAIFIIIFTKTKISFKDVKKKHLLQFAIIFPIAVIFYNYSFLKTTIILGIFSFYMGSIISSLGIGVLKFEEKITPKKVASLIFVLIGLLFFVLQEGKLTIDYGMFLGFIAGIFDTISNSYRKHLSGKLNRVVLTSIPLIGGFLISLLFMNINGEKIFPTISSLSLLIGVIFGLLLFLVNYLLFIGFNNFDLNLGTIVISSELLFAPIFAAIFFQENPNRNEIIGGLFVLLAILTANTNITKRIVNKIGISR